jgi:hypothetical protein
MCHVAGGLHAFSPLRTHLATLELSCLGGRGAVLAAEIESRASCIGACGPMLPANAAQVCSLTDKHASLAGCQAVILCHYGAALVCCVTPAVV